MTDQNQGHLRRVDLERLSVGEAVVGAEHVSSCASCAATLQTMRDEARAFTQRRPAAAVVDRVRALTPTPWWRRWPASLVPVVATAVALVLVLRTDEVRLKGRAFSIVVNGAPLETGTALHGGDQLSFVVESPRPVQVLVLDFEAGKPVTAFVPFGGTRALPVPAGRTVLPDAVLLDETFAHEWLVALVCDAEVSLEALSLAAPWPDTRPALVHPGCQVEVVDLTRPMR